MDRSRFPRRCGPIWAARPSYPARLPALGGAAAPESRSLSRYLDGRLSCGRFRADRPCARPGSGWSFRLVAEEHRECRAMRLLGAREYVVVVADVLREHQRFAAPAIAPFECVVVFVARQQRQRLLHVYPQIGIAAPPLGQDACVFEMTEPDVISGERKPGAIRIGDASRHRVFQLLKILRAGEDALTRIEPIR